jgi:S-adenosylmethionine hydrolase
VVTPDNGTLTHIKAWVGISEVREIDQSVNRLRGKNTEGTSVFHGRDVFGYCAARLASGIITYEGVGPAYPVEEIVTFPILEPVLETVRYAAYLKLAIPTLATCGRISRCRCSLKPGLRMATIST